MVPAWIIERKRDGKALASLEIEQFIKAFVQGQVSDAQMAAMAMAIFFRGMNAEETAALTLAMMNSGETISHEGIAIPKVDKHSTGGIGDKVSLILAPLAAACGLAVPMISGRGLGITGGTLDKLESIPGFRTALSVKEFKKIVETCGCCIAAQTETFVPADKRLYALRDVTATVPSVALITASIMSKKLAEGIDALVLDVKVGRGAFMKSIESARELAESMLSVGRAMGKQVSALITPMDQPIGHTAGNALEVEESVQCLKGQGPKDLMDLVFELGKEMLFLSGKAKDNVEALKLLKSRINDGSAYENFLKMAELQGADIGALEDLSRLPQARLAHKFPAEQSGFVTDVDAEAIGRAAVLLGAGRAQPSDKIDAAAGVRRIAKIGDVVSKGDILLELCANDQRRLDSAREIISSAIKIGNSKPHTHENVLKVLR